MFALTRFNEGCVCFCVCVRAAVCLLLSACVSMESTHPEIWMDGSCRGYCMLLSGFFIQYLCESKI